jgi:hypothetical protein
VTVADIAEALLEGINFNLTDGTSLAEAAFQRIDSPEIIDLEALNAHGATEHVASLTRDDFTSHTAVDTIHLDPVRLTALLADSATDSINVKSLAKSRLRVEDLSPVPMAEKFVQQALGEAALIVMIMHDGPLSSVTDYSTLEAPKDRVYTWLSEERLPTELGWGPPTDQFQLTVLGAISGALVAAEEEMET